MGDSMKLSCSRCGKEVYEDVTHYNGYPLCKSCETKVCVLIDKFVSGEVQVNQKWIVEVHE